MLKDNKIVLLFIVGISFMLLLAGCVDTSVNPIPSSFNFRSQVNVVNFAVGVDNASISMKAADGETISFGAVALGAESPSGSFKDVPAGSKIMSFNSESFKFNTEVDKKMRLFVIGADSSNRQVVKFTQRYIFQTKGDPSNDFLYRKDTSAIGFVNGSPDAKVDSISFVSSDSTIANTTISFPSSLKLGSVGGYWYVKAGTYTVNIIFGDSVLTSINSTKLNAQKRYTIAVYDTAGSLKNKVFTDD